MTTIQKLPRLLRDRADLKVYGQQVVFIFDEAHRSQFGEGQRMLLKRFRRYYQFGFTGTPIFVENALGDETTASVFGEQLHHYIITDAIRDEKVLKFKVDYNNVCPLSKQAEQEQDELRLSSADYRAALRELQTLPEETPEALAALQTKYALSDESLQLLREQDLLSVRSSQDYRSAYNDIRDWLRHEREVEKPEASLVDWDQLTFEVDLLKSQEINLDYILELVFEYNKKSGDKPLLIEELRRLLRSSIEHRAKEGLVVSFVEQLNLDQLTDQATLLADFYLYAQHQMYAEVAVLIAEEGLQEQPAKRYIQQSLSRGYASEYGTDLRSILPKMSPLNPAYREKRQRVLRRIRDFVAKYKGIGSDL